MYHSQAKYVVEKVDVHHSQANVRGSILEVHTSQAESLFEGSPPEPPPATTPGFLSSGPDPAGDPSLNPEMRDKKQPLPRGAEEAWQVCRCECCRCEL